MKTLLFTLALGATGAVALTAGYTLALAQQPYVPPQPSGQGGGGQGVGLAQFQARTRERVMRADTDHDGRISLAEWQAARPNGRGDPARMFRRMDLNHDGYLTSNEIDAISACRFARLDADHDGLLTRDERMAMRRGGQGEDAQMPAGQVQGGRMQGGRGGGGEPVEPLGPR